MQTQTNIIVYFNCPIFFHIYTHPFSLNNYLFLSHGGTV